MKYPKAGDLQRETVSQLTSNPAPTYSEKRGWTGGDTRTLYAIEDNLTGKVSVRPGGGMPGVGPDAIIRIATRAEAERHWQNPLHAGWHVVESNPCERAHRNPWEVRSDSGLEGVFADEDEAHAEADNLRSAGAQSVTVDRREQATRPRPPRHALRNPPSEKEWQERTEREDQERRARLERTGPTPEQLYEEYNSDLAAGVFHGERRGRARNFRNPAGRLFSGVYPTGIAYADREREVDGDYLRVAFLPFSTLRLQWSPGNHPAELREEIEHDSARIIARRGEPFEVSSSGQTVILGGTQQRPMGAPPRYHEPQGRPPGVPNPGARILREKWTDGTEIVVERARYGYTGRLESKRGGGSLPISFGQEPATLREAMELAKKFLRSAHGRSNPSRNPAT